MNHNFDENINRFNTGSLKWDKYGEKDIIPLWVADMDFASPPEILTALHARIDHKVFGYTLPYEDVIGQVLDYLSRVHNYKPSPESLVWVPGIVPALNVACLAFGKKGDAIMTTTPVYPPFLSAPANADKELITTEFIRDGNSWAFDFDAMEKAVTPQTRMYILCNPQNPLGRVFPKEEILKVADFCDRHDLVLCSDEIHCDLILDKNKKHVCSASLDSEIAARTITLMAPSKTYNIAGLACSFAIIENPKIRASFKKAAQGFITEVNALGYTACAEAYRSGEAWRQDLIKYLRDNRDFLYDYIETRIPEIKLNPMQATYLAWLDIRNLKLSNPSSHFEKHGIGLSDGRFFGDKNHLRLNFGCPRSVLKEGLGRIENAVKKS